MTNNSAPVIYEYIDFRKYLADFQAYRFSLDTTFSKSAFSRLLGLPNTRSFFTDVLHGKKITDNFVERFIRVLALTREESQFFRTLVKFNQAVTPEERELQFDQLVSLNRTPKKKLDASIYQYYKEWHHSVVRACLEFVDVNKNVGALQDRIYPSLSVQKIKGSIQLLKKLGLVELKKGYWKPVDKVVTSGEYAKGELIRQRQLKMLEIAQTSLVQSKEKPHRLIAKTIGLSEEGYKRIEKKLSKVSSEINAIIHKDQNKPDRVYQLILSFTPNTK